MDEAASPPARETFAGGIQDGRLFIEKRVGHQQEKNENSLEENRI